MVAVPKYSPAHPVRVVTAAALFDGHDAAINVMRRILQATGAEVIHLGHNRSVAEIVDCAAEHRFEVAESVDMRTFPGSEYGPEAPPPSAARIQQISQEQCSAAVKRYLGPRFDPNSRFTISMLWSGEKAWRTTGERRMLCGLQLPGPNNQQLTFTGKALQWLTLENAIITSKITTNAFVKHAVASINVTRLLVRLFTECCHCSLSY